MTPTELQGSLLRAAERERDGLRDAVADLTRKSEELCRKNGEVLMENALLRKALEHAAKWAEDMKIRSVAWYPEAKAALREKVV